MQRLQVVDELTEPSKQACVRFGCGNASNYQAEIRINKYIEGERDKGVGDKLTSSELDRTPLQEFSRSNN